MPLIPPTCLHLLLPLFATTFINHSTASDLRWFSSTSPTDEQPELCRDRNGYHSVADFRFLSCADCYAYLFAHIDSAKLIALGPWLVQPKPDTLPPATHVDDGNATVDGRSTMNYVAADVDIETSVTFVCSTLDAGDCRRWIECCREAERCCARQQVSRSLSSSGQQLLESSNSTTDRSVPGQCPATWDGFGCWDTLDAGTVHSSSCPSYIPYVQHREMAHKQCTANGSWFRDPSTQLEWTDYTDCVSIQHMESSAVTSIVCNVLSLTLLLPSVTIFVCYRPLRSQQRIQLHIHLFMSLILYAIVHVVWDIVIVFDSLNQPVTATTIHANSIGCRLLYVLASYTRSVNYLWMFSEALYLHRLMAKAFETPNHFCCIFALPWLLPWIPLVIYIVLRVLKSNDKCWIEDYGALEWVIYGPNLAALSLNLFFLSNILRILLTRMQSLPNDSRLNKYRRAVRATFILAPLFGVQFFLIIYRPPIDSSFSNHYEIIAAFVTNSQGIFVSLVFCLLNAEVISCVKKSYARFRTSWRGRATTRNVTNTHTETVSSHDRKNSILSSRKLSYVALTGSHRASIASTVDDRRPVGHGASVGASLTSVVLDGPLRISRSSELTDRHTITATTSFIDRTADKVT